jgi:capsular polysaccharide export protein
MGAVFEMTTTKRWNPTLGKVAVFSHGISKIPHLAELLGAERLLFRPKRPTGLDGVVGWGHKPTAARARAFATQHGLPYWRLEDGFLRSASAREKGPPLSLVLDDVGIYYDATGPSRLEEWLAAPGPVADEGELRRASECRARLVNENLGKYNHAFGEPPSWLVAAKRPVVLVVDQTRGDASVNLGNASEQSFQRVLDAALSEHPEATVVVKTHPDVVTDGKRGHFAKVGRRARLLTESVDPTLLLRVVDRVYVVTSGLGFEALLRGVPVTCFGAPFYAGWGLTDDRVAVERRGVNRSLDELTACALIRYPRYVDPVTG